MDGGGGEVPEDAHFTDTHRTNVVRELEYIPGAPIIRVRIAVSPGAAGDMKPRARLLFPAEPAAGRVERSVVFDQGHTFSRSMADAPSILLRGEYVGSSRRVSFRERVVSES